MNEKRNGSQPPSGGLTLSDIYHVMFRHKWKIVVLTTVGFLVAAGIYVKRPSVFESHAKVMIKSVRENPVGPTSVERGQEVTSTPDGLILNEQAILSSFDLCLMVATNMTPPKILGKDADANAYIEAANAIHDSLVVERAGKSGGIISIVLLHKDVTMVQPILREIISAYKDYHAKIHVPAGAALEVVSTQSSFIHGRMIELEGRLLDAKNKAGVIDVEAARKSNESEISRLKSDISAAGTDLEQHKVLLAKFEAATKTAKVASTNSTDTNIVAEVPHELVDRYQDLSEYINSLKDSLAQTKLIYSEKSPIVQAKKTKLDEQRKLKRQMEEDEPRLTKLGVKETSGGQASVSSSGFDPVLGEQAIVASLEFKIKHLQTNLVEVNFNSTNLESQLGNIHDIERQLAVLEDNYKSSLTQLENAKIGSQIGSALAGANIAVPEEPTPAARERSKTPKMMAIASASGIILGLLWAFVVELYLDTTVKRPKEIENDLGMRLFLSIPDVTRKGYRRISFENGKAANGESNGTQNGSEAVAANGQGKLEVAPWDSNHSLHDYYEALRDRLISYFDVNNLTHKPKLVAVSGPTRGCGTSTIAAGLAASLSETGDGNVLLVDMNLENGASKEFFKGKPGCELDAALGNETRDGAHVHENLYVVNGSTNGDKLSRMLPKRFANLMPKLRASDYDYIIFDMPPLSRTGVAQRLAGFMDMMLLVVEAEKTNREVVRQAGSLLNESKANVSVVLNKTRNYIPASLHQEF